MTPAPERLVFVAGLHRSGTTPLARWLEASEHVAGLHAPHVYESEGQHLQALLPRAIDHGGPGRFAFAPEMHLTERSALATPGVAARLLAAWAPYWSLERPLLLEKSPPNLLRTRLLQALFPGAAFVVVLRHPVSVALATEKWFHAPRRWVMMPSLLVHWLRAHERFVADATRLDNVLVLRYEDLVARPRPVLARVGEFLGLPEPPPAPANAAGGVNAAYFAEWHSWRKPLRRVLGGASAAALEARTRRFGYSLRSLESTPPSDAGFTALLAGRRNTPVALDRSRGPA